MVGILGKADGYAVRFPSDPADDAAMERRLNAFDDAFAEELSVLVADIEGMAPDIFDVDGLKCGYLNTTEHPVRPLEVILMRVGPFPEIAVFTVDRNKKAAVIVDILNPRAGAACDRALDRCRHLRARP